MTIFGIDEKLVDSAESQKLYQYYMEKNFGSSHDDLVDTRHEFLTKRFDFVPWEEKENKDEK